MAHRAKARNVDDEVMESKQHSCHQSRPAHFVGGPADGTMRLTEIDESGFLITHVYVPDEDPNWRHLYGLVYGAAEYRYLGPLAA